jgi:hypothetical protein
MRLPPVHHQEVQARCAGYDFAFALRVVGGTSLPDRGRSAPRLARACVAKRYARRGLCVCLLVGAGCVALPQRVLRLFNGGIGVGRANSRITGRNATLNRIGGARGES